MQLILTEQDYEQSLSKAAVRKLRGEKGEAILGPDEAGTVLQALPRVLADRIRRMIPENYEVREIQIKVAFSGAPFGVGVAGDAVVKFGPKAAGG